MSELKYLIITFWIYVITNIMLKLLIVNSINVPLEGCIYKLVKYIDICIYFLIIKHAPYAVSISDLMYFLEVNNFPELLNP